MQRTEVGEAREAFRVGPKGLERHAAQAQPDQEREPHRSGACDAQLHRPRPRRRRVVARARHQPQLGRAHRARRRRHPHRLRARARHRSRRQPRGQRRAHAREPRRVVRPRVQPARAARAGGDGHAARRGVPHRAAQRDEGVGDTARRSARCSKTTPTSPTRRRRPRRPRRRLRPHPLAPPHRPHLRRPEGRFK